MKTSLALFAVAGFAAAVSAQNNAVPQADNTRIQRETDKVLRDLRAGDDVPALYSGEDADFGPQTILRKKKQTWVRGMWDGQMFYTDNMNFADRREREAVVAVNSLEAALTPPGCVTRCGSFKPEIGYRHQFFNYLGGNHRGEFDFDSSTAFADVRMRTAHYEAHVGFDYTRLFGSKELHGEDYDNFYTEYVPRWSLQRNFRVCERSMFSLAYLGSYHFTDEETPLISPPFLRLLAPDDRSERWEHTFLAAHTVALPNSFVLQPYYRFQINDFVNGQDNYYIHAFGAALGWFPCANFSVRTFVNYSWSDSPNPHVTEYTKLDAGAGVTATLRF